VSDLSTAIFDALAWYVSAFKAEHGAHGRDCWICNAAHEQLDHLEEAFAAALDEALEPEDELAEAAA
jgi:hypothetical protein